MDKTRETLSEADSLRMQLASSERRAIMFGDIVAQQVIAMRAAYVAWRLEDSDAGAVWIANTLIGPGHLPDIDEAKALGGAQALFDREMAEHEAFRAAHPIKPHITEADAAADLAGTPRPDNPSA